MTGVFGGRRLPAAFRRLIQTARRRLHRIADLKSGGLIRPDFRAFFARAANGFFQSRHLTSETKPTFSGRDEAPAIPGVAFCLR
jgi:hypothetical protein